MNKNVLKWISLIALVTTLVPSFLYFKGVMAHDAVTLVALLGTLVWFAVTPLWMGRKIDKRDLHPSGEPTGEI